MAHFIKTRTEARHVELKDGNKKKTVMMFKYSEQKISQSGRERKVPLAINGLEKTEGVWNAVLRSPSTPLYWKKFEPHVDLKLPSTREPFYDKYEINDEYFEAIENLIEKTWDPKFVGSGKDARSLKHSGIKIRKIERIENIELFHHYSSKRDYIIRSMLRKDCTKYPDLGDLTKGGEIMTKGSDILNESLYLDINEHYVFHGTKPDLIGNISKYGLDPRKSTGGKMLGKGIYGAENPIKADQYADDKDDRHSKGLKMLLVRMLIGYPKVVEEPNKDFQHPPCSDCQEKACKNEEHTDYDSVIGEEKWIHREFVVYSKDECYPEYIITYDRV